MLRWVLVVLVVALGAGAWQLLRSPEPAAPARALVVEPEPDPEPLHAVAELRGDVREVPERTTVAGPGDIGTAEATAPVVAATGVLAGRLLLDGGPLGESAVLVLAAADRSNAAHVAANGELRADALGRFRREGLPEDWTGALYLRPPFAVRLETGARRGWSQSVQVERLREDLMIEVVRRPQVRLRALHPDGTPAAGVNVSLRQIRGGSWRGDNARTDADGRAGIARSEQLSSRIEVRVHTDDGASAVREYEGDALPAPLPSGDVDLGDIALAAGRRVTLRITDAEGTPLPSLRLALEAGGRTETLDTDDDARVTLGFEAGAVVLTLEADGWWPAEVQLPAAVEEYEVALRRANRLRIEVVDAEGRPIVGRPVRLQARRPLFGEDRPFPPGFLLGHHGVSATSDLDLHSCDLPLDEQGVVECSGFVPGLELLVLLRAPFETVLAEERVPGLGEAEQRVVRLRVERELCTLEVHVLDADGRPVPGVAVTAIHEEASTGATTDAAGVARIEELAVPFVELRAQSSESAEALLPDVGSCSGPVTMHLEAARTLEVELRDAEGHAVRAGQLALLDPTGARTFERRTPTGGFAGLPFQPLTLVWSLCGEERRVAIDAAQTRAELLVPPLGEVVVAVEGWAPGERQHAHLRIEPLDGSALVCDDAYLADEPRPVPLWPGRYRLTVEVRDYANGSPPVTTPLGTPHEVEVSADSTSSVTFRP